MDRSSGIRERKTDEIRGTILPQYTPSPKSIFNSQLMWEARPLTPDLRPLFHSHITVCP